MAPSYSVNTPILIDLSKSVVSKAELRAELRAGPRAGLRRGLRCGLGCGFGTFGRRLRGGCERLGKAAIEAAAAAALAAAVAAGRAKRERGRSMCM